jgi:RNA-directed DNA polymerase
MIVNIKHLCYILKTDIGTIQRITSDTKSYYISWQKKKFDKNTNLPILNADGTSAMRPLNSTKIELKKIQKRIYTFLLKNVEMPKYAYGGVSKRDNVLNAKQHQGNKFIFNTDLKSYFPSISHKQVFALFRELGFSPTVARILTKLTTYERRVPQGVPTSTLIANLVFKKTGDKILNFAELNQMKFTIFVDDLTMSSKIDFKNKIPAILEIITNDGYKISHKKTSYKTKNPIITGVICQNDKLKLGNSFHKRIAKLEKQIKANPGDITAINKHKGLLLYRKKVDDSNIKH